MSIALPNTFSCRLRTAVFDGDTAVDFTGLAQPGLPAELGRQLVTRRFLITTSTVCSTLSAAHAVDFVETLVKVPVTLGGRCYLFPVVTYVNDEYSLIRGYLLGFHKRMVAAGNMPRRHMLVAPGVDLDFRDCGEAAPVSWQSPPEQQYPMLLWTDYDLGNGVRSHGYATLAIEDYACQAMRGLSIARPAQIVAGRAAVTEELYEIHDSFVITRTVPLAD